MTTATIRTDRIAEVYQLAKHDPTSAYNCWGASRYLAGLQDQLTWYNDKDSWLAYLTENGRVVRKLKVGDILAIVDGKELLHTATVLDTVGRVVYLHKRGMNTAEVATYKQVRDTYPRGRAIHYRLAAPKLTLQ